VLARAGEADSARHLLKRSQANAIIDPTRDIALVSAMMYMLLDDTTAVLDQLTQYLAANPGRRADWAEDPGWRFAGLKNDPRFRRLVESGR
jgi:hypothetical protein